MGVNLYLKAECNQINGSFKSRGAYFAMHQYFQKNEKKDVVAFSSGNHAQGVAYSANLMGVKATIVMPEDTPKTKIHKTFYLAILAPLTLTGCIKTAEVTNGNYKASTNSTLINKRSETSPAKLWKYVNKIKSREKDILRTYDDTEMYKFPDIDGKMINSMPLRQPIRMSSSLGGHVGVSGIGLDKKKCDYQ